MRSTPIPEPRQERWHVEIPSPVGPLRVVAGATAIVGLYHRAHDPAPSGAALGQSLFPDGPAGARGPDEGAVTTAPLGVRALLERAGDELDEYFSGARQEFGVGIHLQGTLFQREVWAALREIPYGERRSYRDIAGQLGNARMGRAIGAAVRANPISILVPGHRVVSRTGAVIGYAAGIEAKRTLLELELGHDRSPAP